MNLDRRAKLQAVVMSAAAQVVGFAAASLATVGQPAPSSSAQLLVAAGYTLLSSTMALHVAYRMQVARKAQA